MSIKRIWYQSVKIFLKVSLQFFTKEIKVLGRENVPKQGAVLFAINHPNALMDPLYVTANNPRENHFLVRADVFKKPLIRWFLGTLNLMPIYRIRDGRSQLVNNQEIFEKCFKILSNEETLFIFPQGGHSRERTIPQLSKGFTRIVFGALERHAKLEITVLPVGITYQNSSVFPSKVCVNFGQPIKSREILESNGTGKATQILKSEVSEQLKALSVHIPKDENFKETLDNLNNANVDFTEVKEVNSLISSMKFPQPRKKTTNLVKPLYFLIVINGIIPFIIWRKVRKGIKDIEFVDTLKYGFNIILFPLFYSIQSLIIGSIYGMNYGIAYLSILFLTVFIYVKTAPTNTEN